ncbi:MBL fold metallo-hydrolase [Microlunatus capsulatus]|uniref:Glyoxylase-like metal-dependent hydrolase (Beta-lactamase superfamily II) n=1 Tax=Microlunatus capsulatus TaxID=99117 RepID=A0ABS4ZBL2_9ACTN|nr:MBL fold metallo-hydrolase [Microlunatus capsulatus]MBP2418435.1 glyoxylase-like metal-dependent hydrolase (beta-lactamase superfamily II) [Microlunatus capsulatus]
MPGPHHVEPGGEPLVLPLAPTLTLTKVSVGPMDNNAYLLRTPDAALLVDAAAEPERLLAVTGADLATVVTTHRHGDHWQALAAVAGATGAALVCGRPDVDAIATGAWVEGLVGVWDGDVVAVGSHRLEVIGLVGHTPGSVALAWTGEDGPTHLFTGDGLFPGGPGKTAGPPEFASLLDDLEAKVFARFGDDTVVHPGHGDGTTLGAERPHLAEWRARGW